MSCKLKIGVMLYHHGAPEEPINKVKSLGLQSCQVGWGPGTPLEKGVALKAAADAAGIEVNTLWAGLPGPAVWNFTAGPHTIGLVPVQWRAPRSARLAGTYLPRARPR